MQPYLHPLGIMRYIQNNNIVSQNFAHTDHEKNMANFIYKHVQSEENDRTLELNAETTRQNPVFYLSDFFFTKSGIEMLEQVSGSLYILCHPLFIVSI